MTVFLFLCPLPPLFSSPTGWPLDSGLLYSMETLIVQWSGQIWNVLRKDSGKLLLSGDNPGPNIEIQFWTTQRENLEGIHLQVRLRKRCALYFMWGFFFHIIWR